MKNCTFAEAVKKKQNKAIEGEDIKELELALGRWFCGSRDRGGVRKSRN